MRRADDRSDDKLSANPRRILSGVIPEERVSSSAATGEGTTDEREQALQYAARLRGLSLVRIGDQYALATYVLTDASLDDIAAYLTADDGATGPDATPGNRRADLRAMIKAERALLDEIAQETRKAGESRERATTETALAEIRRRIAEIQNEMGHKGGP